MRESAIPSCRKFATKNRCNFYAANLWLHLEICQWKFGWEGKVGEAGAMVMGANGREDVQSQGKRSASVVSGDDGLGAGADGVKEGFQFEAQGFVF